MKTKYKDFLKVVCVILIIFSALDLAVAVMDIFDGVGFVILMLTVADAITSGIGGIFVLMQKPVRQCRITGFIMVLLTIINSLSDMFRFESKMMLVNLPINLILPVIYLIGVYRMTEEDS